MSRETVLSNARIVLDDEVRLGSMLIRDGLIADVGSDPRAAGLDLGGDYLLPGLVELHTDHLERHFTPRPGVQWDPLPAALASDAQLAAAGVTTVLDAVRIGSASNQNDAAAAAARVLADSIEQAADAGLLRADHAIHVRCEVAAEDCLDAFGEFGDDPYVQLVSLMDHTPGQRQFADMELFKRYHIAKGNVTESVELGVRISEFPTTVLAATAADKHGQLIVMGAPNIVRGGSQSGNVAAAELLGLGLLHILSSDYVPSSPLQAVFQLAVDTAIGLVDGVRLVSGNPARAVGFDDRGVIAIGQRADLVQVRPHDLPASERHPRGRRVPVVRSVYRQGARVS
jgi:alpha-D-ribose 1-methylphosphonate 5-triphosphate diphosphatase